MKRTLLIAAVLLLSLIAIEIYFQIFDPYHYAEVEDRESFMRDIFDRSGKVRKLHHDTKCSYLGHEVIINSQGMRNPEITIEKPDGVYRILVIGDSIAFGWGVDEASPFPRQLERMLNEKVRADAWPDLQGKTVQIVNSAVPGWGIIEEFDFLKQKGFDYEPDLILWSLVFNDVPDEMTPEGPARYHPLSLFDSRLLRFLRITLHDWIAGPLPSDFDPRDRIKPKGIEIICASLKHLRRICRDKGVPIVLLDGICDDQIKRCCRQIGMKRIDLDFSWEKLLEYKVSLHDEHPNAEYHLLMAQKVHDALVSLID